MHRDVVSVLSAVERRTRRLLLAARRLADAVGPERDRARRVAQVALARRAVAS